MPTIRTPALRRPTLAVAALLLAACAQGGGSPAAFSARDSAGIRLTMAPTPETSDSTPWSLAFTVGAAGDSPEYPFDAVAGIVLRNDGSLVVADGGSRQLLFFDATGQFVRAVGRSGRGPGEFAGEIELLPYRRDSLLVWEFGRRQLTVLDRDGQVGRIAAITVAEPNPFVIGAWPDGSLLVGSRHLRLSPGANADSVTLQRLTPDVRPFPVQGWFRTGVVHFQMTGSGPVVDNHPFMPAASVAVGEGGFVVASGEVAMVQAIDPAGRLTARHWWGHETGPLEPGEVAAWKQRDLGNQANEATRAVREAWLADLELPERAPATSGVRLATDGARWVQRFALAASPSRYDRLAPDGRWLETVVIPAEFVLWAATSDLAVGVRRDTEGVERVAVFRRPAS